MDLDHFREQEVFKLTCQDNYSLEERLFTHLVQPARLFFSIAAE